MASDEPKVALYDFLYRDSARIASYSAQLFGGRLASLEKSDANRSAVQKDAVIETSIAQAAIRSTQETASDARRTYAPHESETIDVLNRLKEQGYIHPSNDVRSSPHGSLVLAKGTVVFLDSGIIRMASFALDAAITAEKAKPGRQQDRNTIASIGLIKSMFTAITIPSAFLLDTNGIQVVGTVKESGMEEPISTYYFRHGTAGLSDVYLLGVKEVASATLSMPGKDLMASGQEAAKALNEMLFPASATRVTPILLFRKL